MAIIVVARHGPLATGKEKLMTLRNKWFWTALAILVGLLFFPFTRLVTIRVLSFVLPLGTRPDDLLAWVLLVLFGSVVFIRQRRERKRKLQSYRQYSNDLVALLEDRLQMQPNQEIDEILNVHARNKYRIEDLKPGDEIRRLEILATNLIGTQVPDGVTYLQLKHLALNGEKLPTSSRELSLAPVHGDWKIDEIRNPHMNVRGAFDIILEEENRGKKVR